MSPRPIDPTIRPALVEAAAKLLAEEGPGALSARRLTAEVGTSTMSVYTYFGGMEDLVRAMVHEGFARLHTHMGEVRHTSDPVADLATLGRAYWHNALANRHLYAVMFGGSSPGGFSLTDEDRQHGRYTLAPVVGGVVRSMEAGRLRQDDAELVAHQMWSALHGLVTLELGGYLIDAYDGDRLLEAQLCGLIVAAGDTVEAAHRSVSRSRRRVHRELSIHLAPDAAGGPAGEVRPADPAAAEKPSRRRVREGQLVARGDGLA